MVASADSFFLAFCPFVNSSVASWTSFLPLPTILLINLASASEPLISISFKKPSSVSSYLVVKDATDLEIVDSVPSVTDLVTSVLKSVLILVRSCTAFL